MKTIHTAVAVLAATLLLGACSNKEEADPAADAAPAPAADPAPMPEPAPADETVPPPDNSEDAEQSGGDKVRP
jgi:PBP1b-binding outer membrane lipoprotein LpoB